MLVQLLSAKHLDVDGKARTYYPGDYVDVGRQTALAWIARGEATTAEMRAGLPADVELEPDCGIYVTGEHPQLTKALRPFAGIQARSLVGASIAHARALVLTPPAVVRPDHLLVGFGYLSRWEVVVPLRDGYPTADTVGSHEERELTASAIRDLRVPLYDSRVLFVRQSVGADRLLTLWRDERRQGQDEGLAFLRALYQAKPLVLALPPTWVQ